MVDQRRFAGASTTRKVTRTLPAPSERRACIASRWPLAASCSLRKAAITADCGGSNSYRCRLWKVELQAFANETGLRVRVAHYPPGTSKWNKIEHRLFSQITANRRGRPLTTYQTIVDLIGATKTTTGLQVFAHLDTRTYEKGREVTDAEMATLRVKRDSFHGEWNYVLLPKDQR